MKRMTAAAIGLMAAFFLGGCTNPSTSSSSSTGSTDTIPTYLSFESDTPSYPENSTLSGAGDNGFFSVLYGDTQVTSTASGLGSSGTSDTSTTLANPTISKSTEQVKVGERSVKIGHLWRQAHYMVPVAEGTDTTKYNVLMSSTYLKVGMSGTDGAVTSLLGNIPGTVQLPSTSPYSGSAYSVANAWGIDNRAKTVAYKVNVYVPADSTINKFGLVFYDVGQNPLQSHYQGVTKGQWNRFVFYVKGAETSSNLLTNPDTLKTVPAYVSSVLVNGAAGSAGNDYVGSSFDPSGVRFLGFRVFNTDGTAAADGALTYYLDDIGWIEQTPVASAPVIDVAAGTYSAAQTVTLTSSTPAAKIYYTLDGTEPTSASTLYSAAITINATETLKAVTVASGYDNSSIASAAYVLQPIVTAAVDSGSSTTAVSASFTVAPTDADLRYTMTSDGTTPDDPTATTGTSYTAALDLAVPASGQTTYTIKVAAFKTGWTDSAVVTRTYLVGTAVTTNTVTFDLNYTGSTGAPTSQVVLTGSTATSPTDPTRDGYVFGGWYTDAACASSYSFSTLVTSDLTLYAKWSLSSITFEGDAVGTSYSSIGWSGSASNTTSVVTISSVTAGTGLPANGTSVNVLKVTPLNYNAAVLFTITIPTGKTLADYTSVSVDAYFPRSTLGLSSDGDNYYKPLYLFAGTTISGAAQTSNAAYQSTYDTVYSDVDAWKSFTLAIDSTKGALLSGTIQIAIGLNRPADATNDDAYYLDNIQLK